MENNKRKVDGSFANEENQRKQTKIDDYWLAKPMVPTYNPFAPLTIVEEIQDKDKEQEKEKEKEKTDPKPPPIFVHNVQEITPLTALLETEAKDAYTYKTLRNFTVKIQAQNSDSFRRIHKALKDKKTEMHSYQLKSDKGFRVVLKGLHHSTCGEDIKNALQVLGHHVIRINNKRCRQTKKPLPLFDIELAVSSSNHQIYSVNRLLNCVVEIEPPRPNKEIIQCTRCQRFGHSKAYCLRETRCVKCLESHWTSECPRKNKDQNVRCVNCNGYHPANYRGCEAHLRAKAQRRSDLRGRVREAIREGRESRAQNFNVGKSVNNSASAIRGGVTYANVTSGEIGTIPSDTHVNVNLSQNRQNPADSNSDMSELRSMMRTLTEQMTSMLSIMNTLVNLMGQKNQK
ncbi:hypothetical protein DMENIID0001_004320 [Sergentomyia squamirostris]